MSYDSNSIPFGCILNDIPHTNTKNITRIIV